MTSWTRFRLKQITLRRIIINIFAEDDNFVENDNFAEDSNIAEDNNFAKEKYIVTRCSRWLHEQCLVADRVPLKRGNC